MIGFSVAMSQNPVFAYFYFIVVPATKFPINGLYSVGFVGCFFHRIAETWDPKLCLKRVLAIGAYRKEKNIPIFIQLNISQPNISSIL